MSDINYWAVAVAAVAAFLVSSVWYAVFSAQPAVVGQGHPETTATVNKTPAWKFVVEFFRSLVVAAVLSGLAVQVGVDGWTDALLLGLAAWIGFPVPILAGSVLWEDVPWRVAATHVGDWLAKLGVIAVIVGLWH